jgi:hypothetical protein
MKKYIFTILFLVTLLITPVLGQTDIKCVGGAAGEKCGQTETSDVDLIARLRAQIATLTAQLNQALAQQREGFCYRFDRNFSGDDISNPDWTKMGQVLRIEGVSSVKELQEKYSEDVLRPSGLRLGTGYVGPSTRVFLNRLYKCNNQAPVISGISGPTSLKVGEMGTWTVKATDPLKGILNYQVTWGDEKYAMGLIPAEPSTDAAPQVSTFTHAYASPGTYSINVTVIASGSRNAQASITVKVSNSVQSPISVISPNGGETWTTYDKRDIKWNWPNAKRTDKVDIYLDFMGSCGSDTAAGLCAQAYFSPYVLDRNISARATYNWIVATDINNKKISAGRYRVRICEAGSQTNCDSSDNYFTIVAPAQLMRVCPQTKVINKMPQVAPISASTPSPSVYFIMNGTRWELEHFDLDWVTHNCSVKEETVY